MPDNGYEVDGAPEKHDRNVWEGKEGPPPYYVLKTSKSAQEGGQPKRYNCSESALAKLENRPPKDPDDADMTETDEIEAKLKAPPFSFVELESPEGSLAPADCACKKKTKCVVLYFDRNAGEPRNPYHVAVFDPRTCDWGGKESGHGEVRRYRNPGDYIEWRRRKAAEQGLPPPNDTMVFLCPPEQDGAWMPPSDSWVHDQANPRTTTETQGRGGCAGGVVLLVALSGLAISLT